MDNQDLTPEMKRAADALKKASRAVIDSGETLYLVTSKRDVDTFETCWRKIAAYVPVGFSSTWLARIVDGVARVAFVRNPDECSRGRVRHYLRALEQISNLRRGSGQLVCLEAPPYTDECRLLQYRAWLNDPRGDAHHAWLDGIELDGLVEVDPWVADDRFRSEREACLELLNYEIGAVVYGGEFRVVRFIKDPETRLPALDFVSTATAASMYAAHYYEDENGERVNSFPMWKKSPGRRMYEHVVFRPEPPSLKPSRKEGAFGMWPSELNLFLGWRFRPETVAAHCDYTIFRAHMFENVCGSDPKLFKWLWAWMAQLVQQPAKRPGTALVLWSAEQGTGKTLFGQVLGKLMHPDHYLSVSQKSHLVGNFNRHLGAKLLIQVEEAIWAGDKAGEGVLKDLITNDSLTIEPKGLEVLRVPNCARVIFTTNSEWAIPAAEDERRFAVLHVRDGWKQDRVAFGNMLAQLEDGGYEALLEDLLETDLTEYPDPSVVPNTEALRLQKVQSLDTIGRWWFDQLSTGTIDTDWPAEVSSSGLYDRYVAATRSLGRGQPEGQERFGRRLRHLCPMIERRRPRTGGGRVWVYALPALDAARLAFEKVIGGSLAWE
jgi:hypothetical protein